MEKSFEEAAAERRDYVDQVRASFYEPSAERSWSSSSYCYGAGQEAGLQAGASGFGIRLVIAILLFAGFGYCDQKNITFHTYGAADVVKQMEWNPLPVEQFVEMVMAQPQQEAAPQKEKEK